jgi:hypothetical protein
MSRMLNAAAITLDHEEYARRRPEERSRMIALRRERRVRVGDLLSFSFENTETLTYQVQEMAFTEGLNDLADLEQEIDLYGRMVPDSHSLVATMLVELTDQVTIKEELARLEGLQRSVYLELWTPDSAQRVHADEIRAPDEDPDVPTPLVSVHVLRFRFTDQARDAFRNPTVNAELVVDHPEYADAATIAGASRTALLADLTLRD